VLLLDHQDIDGVNDGKDFKEVCVALSDVGINPLQQQVLFSVVSGVLWLGNLTFVSADGGESSNVEQDEALEACSTLLSIRPKVRCSVKARQPCLLELYLDIVNRSEYCNYR
jgi:myosin heavy subunit